MKSNLTILFCIAFYSVIGQGFYPDSIETNGRTATQVFDSISAGLIPSRIPYGVLYNRVAGFS